MTVTTREARAAARRNPSIVMHRVMRTDGEQRTRGSQTRALQHMEDRACLQHVLLLTCVRIYHKLTIYQLFRQIISSKAQHVS